MGLLVYLALLQDGYVTEYDTAVTSARKASKQVFMTFDDDTPFPWLLEDEYIFARLTRDATCNGKRVLDHSAFSHLQNGPGVAVVDLRKDSPQYGHVTLSIPSKHLTTNSRRLEIFRLPDGTLTQRTLVWAIRVHAARPKSTECPPGPRLMQHATRHCWTQCRMHWQHHAIPPYARSEIVAESWPWNKDVTTAAIDIVWSWSQSPGHWSAVMRRHNFYGYDMQSNGRKWFATGVFR